MVEEQVLDKVVELLKSYRPGLSRDQIRSIIEMFLRTGSKPLAETDEDVMAAYKLALSRKKS